MSRNLTTQLVDLAEHALRSWFGDDITREDAERALPSWRFSGGLDSEMRDEIVARFPKAEPPSVPGLDFLPSTQADAAVLVAEAVAVLDEPTARRFADKAGDLWHEMPDGRLMIADRDGNANPEWGGALRSYVEATYGPLVELPAPEVWDDSVPPGGFVCGVCRTPVESEPCELHGAVES